MDHLITVSDRELAILLAALRITQQDYALHQLHLMPQIEALPDYRDRRPISSGDIDDLCERLN